MADKQTWSILVKRLIGWFNPGSSGLKNHANTPDDQVVVGESFAVPFDSTHTATAIHVSPHASPQEVLAALDLPPYQGVLVVHGGAGQMEPHYMAVTRQFLTESVVPLAEKYRLLVLDGGTQSGTGRILGEVREALNGTFPLLGVTPEGCVVYPPGPPPSEKPPERRNELNTSHSYFIFVRGSEFGVESTLLVDLLRATGRPGAAFVINGGDIVLQEVHMHCKQGNTVITLKGSGRIADQLADPLSDERQQMPPCAALHVADVTDPQGCVDLLKRVLLLPA